MLWSTSELVLDTTVGWKHRKRRNNMKTKRVTVNPGVLSVGSSLLNYRQTISTTVSINYSLDITLHLCLLSAHSNSAQFDSFISVSPFVTCCLCLSVAPHRTQNSTVYNCNLFFSVSISLLLPPHSLQSISLLSFSSVYVSSIQWCSFAYSFSV